MTRVAKVSRKVQDEISATKGKRPRGKQLTLKERATIDTVIENGGTVADAMRATGVGRKAIQRHLKDARDYLQGNAETYAKLHLSAAKVAAENGNATPAQWALERLGVVEARESLIKRPEGNGLTIQLGVMLPGLPNQTTQLVLPAGDSPQVIDSEDDSEA